MGTERSKLGPSPQADPKTRIQLQVVCSGNEARKGQQHSGEVKWGGKTLGHHGHRLGNSRDDVNVLWGYFEGAGGLAHQLCSVKDESFS